jgi:ribosomal protein S10
MKSIKIILTSNLNKVLDTEVQLCKDIIRSCGGVVTGPVCFKGQRQITYHHPTSKCLDRLGGIKLHKSIKVNVLAY